jgi:hypothetical protein
MTGAAFTADVILKDDEGLVRGGVRGQARIRVDSQTLATRTWRMICSTVRFRS